MALTKEQLETAGKIVGLAAILVITWKLTVELPKAMENAKTPSEKFGALTILL